MKGFVQGVDRRQTMLLPECLDDWIGESNPIRAVDVFVDALEFRDLGSMASIRQRPAGRRNILRRCSSCITLPVL
jgi:transposase